MAWEGGCGKKDVGKMRRKFYLKWLAGWLWVEWRRKNEKKILPKVAWEGGCG